MNRSKRLEIKLSTKEREIFEKVADFVGSSSLSSMVRMLVLSKYAKEVKDNEK